MLFNPHSQIQEEPPTRTSHNSLTSHYFISNSNPLLHHIPQYYRTEELGTGLNETNRSSQESLNSSNVCSYDIYGNELSLEDDRLADMLEPREMDLESIQEEEVMSPDGVTINQENNDPVLHMITPLKKRSNRTGVNERRRSFAINRSPLIDITPVSKRKKSHNFEAKIEGSLLTPRDDSKRNNDVMFTRRLR